MTPPAFSEGFAQPTECKAKAPPRKCELTSWKLPDVKRYLVQTAASRTSLGNKKISDKTIIEEQFRAWLGHLKSRNKYAALYFHPALSAEDEQVLVELNYALQKNKLKWAFGFTAATYLTYYFGFRHWPIFYAFTRKDAGLVRRASRVLVKYFVVPVAVLNVYSGIVEYFGKDYLDSNLREKGLFKKYHLEYILEDKPF